MIDVSTARMAAPNVQERQEPAGSAPPQAEASRPAPTERPAVLLSLSEEALARLDAARQTKPVPDPARLRKTLELADLNHRIDMIDRGEKVWRPLNEASIERLDRSYAKMRDTPPRPAVQLNEQQIEDILEKVAHRGIDPDKIGGYDTYSFHHEGMIYTFLKDGTAWVHEGGVARSAEERMRALHSIRDSQSWHANRIAAIDEGIASRPALIEQRDALAAEVAALEEARSAA